MLNSQSIFILLVFLFVRTFVLVLHLSIVGCLLSPSFYLVFEVQPNSKKWNICTKVECNKKRKEKKNPRCKGIHYWLNGKKIECFQNLPSFKCDSITAALDTQLPTACVHGSWLWWAIDSSIIWLPEYVFCVWCIVFKKHRASFRKWRLIINSWPINNVGCVVGQKQIFR